MTDQPGEHEPLAEAAVLIREAMDQLSPPAFYGPGSWWERALDWLEAAESRQGGP